MAGEIWSVGRVLAWTQNYFSGKNISAPRLDAEVLLAHVLKKERIYLYVHFDEPLNRSELAAFRALVKERAARKPVAYLIGHREFMGLDFAVNEHTLIPRPETEILVSAILDKLKERPDEELLGADIGTGTGAIALSLLKYRENLRMKATDISPTALEVAQKNAENLGLASKIEFLSGDLTAPLKGEKFRFIVSNPPYIPRGDLATLAPEVLAEPRTALDGGIDGLAFYRRLAENAPLLLDEHGFLAVEIGINQVDRVVKMFREAGRFTKTQVIKDLAGIDRVVLAWREK